MALDASANRCSGGVLKATPFRLSITLSLLPLAAACRPMTTPGQPPARPDGAMNREHGFWRMNGYGYWCWSAECANYCANHRRRSGAARGGAERWNR